MHDYGIGYGKPPRATRFRPGTSGNPKGRPKCASSPLGEIVNDVLNAPVKYRENGRARTSSRREVALKQLVQRAINGDVGAADVLLHKRAQMLRQAGGQANRLLIRDWLPDYPGQTAEQKARDLGSQAVPAEIDDATAR
ncbi:MAG TPA: DUF5681 domain-containing protein [Rhizomicrobium sp.]|nr:DUF5681 domain-containing protein [Rhizomicrobium sp.]